MKELITCGDDEAYPRFDELDENIQEELIAQAMKDDGELAYENITNAPNFDEVVKKVIDTFSEKEGFERVALERQIGGMILEGVKAYVRNFIDKSISEVYDNAPVEKTGVHLLIGDMIETNSVRNLIKESLSMRRR